MPLPYPTYPPKNPSLAVLEVQVMQPIGQPTHLAKEESKTNTLGRLQVRRPVNSLKLHPRLP